MPLQLPNLDDRAYNDLVQEGLALIPTYAAEWTNHNPTDPGITLVELFAYLSELLIYRLNRISDAEVHAFLRLLNGPTWQPSGRPLVEDVQETVLKLRRPERAVTCLDYEHLAREADPRVERARCVPRRDLESENVLARGVEKAGHVSVIIVPDAGGSDLQPGADLIQAVMAYLEPRRLLTTRVHVVGPRFLAVGVRVTLYLRPDALVDDVRARTVTALRQFLHPLTGGPDDQGWPFGRSVYVSEIYTLLDNIEGVDYVTKTVADPATGQTLNELTAGDPARLKHNDSGELTAVELQPDELVEASIAPNDLTIVPPPDLVV